MIDTIKTDMEYILGELWVMRNKEEMKDFRNLEQKDKDPESVGFVHYIKDFRPYRGMVDTLLKSFDNLNKMFDYRLFKDNPEFVEEFLNRLISESESLHQLMEKCKGDYNQYRCLSDVFIKLTDKIGRITKDRPRDMKLEQELKDQVDNLEKVDPNYTMSKEEVDRFIKKYGRDLNISKLLKHQQEVVDFEGENLICDWTRGSGKTFTIAKIIELNKPENVLYINNVGNNYESFNTLCDKFKDININTLKDKSDCDTIIEVKTKTSTKLELFVHDQTNFSSEINVYSLKSLRNGDIDKNTVFDYVFFAECLPYNVGVKSVKSISFISYNDKDEWLERFYPHCKISKSDYRPLVEVGMVSQKMIDRCKESNYKKFLNEYAILDSIETLKPMYIDCVRTDNGNLAYKVLIYVDNKLTILEYSQYKKPMSLKSYAKIIRDMALDKKCIIYIDVRGYGLSMYDLLVEFGDLNINKLVLNKAY